MTVVSDRLSGDDATRATRELNLRRLIDPAGEGAPIVLTRTPERTRFSGDLIVDNLAGWLTSAVGDPSGFFGDFVRKSADSGVWRAWHVLGESTTRLESVPAVDGVNRSLRG